MSGRWRGTAGVLALVIGSAALAACGAAGGGGTDGRAAHGGAGAAATRTTASAASSTASTPTAATSTATSATATSATAPTSTAGTGTSKPSLPGSPSGPLLRVTGTVDEGSKPQCRLLRTARTSYLLLGAEQRLLLGARVTVVGVVLDNVRTMCPGVPLGVVAVHHLAPPPPGQPTGRLTGSYPVR